MNNDEKKLIEDLFSRLHKTEIESSDRDNTAEKLIKNLLEKYPNSPYYMAQTILIQETAIKKLNDKISLLEDNATHREYGKCAPTGFLSSLFRTKKTKNVSDSYSNDTTNQPHVVQSSNSNISSFPTQMRSGAIPQVGPVNSTGGFLSGALQTAAGVAGGVVMANMLMNLFQTKKPEEEVMDAVHNVNASDVDLNTSDSDVMHNSQYISDDTTYSNNTMEEFNQTDYDVNNNDDCNTFEDDNFI
ncbi:MAG: DUF2076 domain-containing protein [Buchnera aphidicola (Meitanaphis elongallis)]